VSLCNAYESTPPLHTLQGGGGIASYGEAGDVFQLTNSYVYYNEGSYYGGGLLISSGTDAEISDTWIYNNTAAYGGGVYLTDGGELRVSHSHVTANEVYIYILKKNNNKNIYIYMNSVHVISTSWSSSSSSEHLP
jgi:hypothetical protein